MSKTKIKDYSEKSHVSMEQKLCVACGKEYDSGSLLLDRRLKNSMHRHTTTGYGLCKECDKEGYAILVEIDESKSQVNPDGTYSAAGAWRTGRIMHVRETAFEHIFDVPLTSRVNYVEAGVIDKLIEVMNNATK